MYALVGVLGSTHLQLVVEQNCVPNTPLIVAFVILEECKQFCSTGEVIARRIAVLDVSGEEPAAWS